MGIIYIKQVTRKGGFYYGGKNMYYENVQTYLNEEFRKPIKYYLKDMPSDVKKNIMHVVDYLCDQYREVNGTALFFEKKSTHTVEEFKEWRNFMVGKGHSLPCDYDSLDDVFSESEVCKG